MYLPYICTTGALDESDNDGAREDSEEIIEDDSGRVTTVYLNYIVKFLTALCRRNSSG